MKISFVVPCYNEEPQVLLRTVEDLSSTLNGLSELEYEIIVVDDGTIGQEYELSNFAGNVMAIRHSYNKGYSSAILSGMKSSKYEWVGILDSDGTYPVNEFPRLIDMLGDHDQVIGKRSWSSIEKTRLPAKLALTFLAQYLAGAHIPDLNSGMRIFKKDIALTFRRYFPKRFSITSTLTMAFLTHDYDVAFIPIDYHQRVGKSHIHPIRDTISFFSLVTRLSLYYNPMRLFVPLCTILGLCGALRSVRDILVTNAIGNLALLLFFMAFQVLFFGLLAEIINKK